MAMSQSRNPRFHSNGVLKLGRVSRSVRDGRNTQGGTTFCLVSIQIRTPEQGKPFVYNM